MPTTPSTPPLLQISFQLLLYTLQQLPPEAQEVAFSPETREEFPFGLQVPRYDPLFKGSTPLPIHTVCVPKTLYRGAPQLGILLENDYLSINDGNYSSFYLHIHPQHPLLQTVPLSAFGTPLHRPHTFSPKETHQLLTTAFPDLDPDHVRQWPHPLTLNPPRLDWPLARAKGGDCSFELTYPQHQPGPLTPDMLPSSNILLEGASSPVRYPRFSFHTLYRHFLLDLLFLQLPPEWIPVQTVSYHLPDDALDDGYSTLKLYPLQPYLKNTPNPAITHLMCQPSFGGALIHVSHPLASPLTSPTFDRDQQPVILRHEDKSPFIHFSALYSFQEYTPEDEPPHPKAWLEATLENLHSISHPLLLQQLSC